MYYRKHTLITENLYPYHLVNRLHSRFSAADSANRIAFSQWHNGQQSELTWQQVETHSTAIAHRLLALNVEVQENIGLFAHNSMNWSLVDLAVLQLKAVTVPLYATSSLEQAAYIINDANIRILFVGEQEQYHVACQLKAFCPQITTIVVLNNDVELVECGVDSVHLAHFMAQAEPKYQEELNQRIAAHHLSDLFTIIYTSGTTGEPKGVMLDYYNMAAQLYLHDQRLKLTDEDVSLSFLPLSHVFERAWSFYVMHTGARNVYLTDTNAVRAALADVKPTVMCAVPRFYEKVYSAVQGKVAKAPLMRRLLFKWAIAQGNKRTQSLARGEQLSAFNQSLFNLADKLVLTKLRQLLGGRIRFMPAAGARLDDDVIAFFLAVGINIKYGYGMTETCATVSCWEEGHYPLGSIGTPLSSVEVRIGDNNEIQVKGPVVMKGYYNRPQDTDEAFTVDGWLKTGDAGEIDAKGNLYITDRLKDLMKTSNGKYIAPQMIEGVLGQDQFIEHIAVIADARKFVSALIVPCYDSLEEYARSINLKYRDRLELLRDSNIVALFESRLKELQKNIETFHQVKRFTLLPANFSMEKGELTPTLKLRRKIISERYHSEIESMYRE
ncbi:long-chain fatty acid--CoA ligase [Providencia vermicola]|uniref:AMP-dependent synthetase/ligase n=1 Tax=Providencia TaxID=586 RepID=UPI00234A54EB|nr:MULTISPECIES: long-chain fatty acid--CoA ligase [Providencia]ELR5140956.1 long-chain fatty acid--CoA ligase [Providencia stuartii]WER23468.1 long-chain fatty acid--CoA ligase [Providencia stuartii]WER27589.1 long-chain fatty acid--CoA ligase [Providencia stuartii]WER31679.1 long-chain fatty acid--CoA ligase [Providencia stuartii]